MEPIRAQILRGDNVVLENVDGRLHETPGPSLTSWSGHFDVGQQPVDWMSGTFRMILEDGRSCEFFVTASHPEAGIDFQVCSPLK